MAIRCLKSDFLRREHGFDLYLNGHTHLLPHGFQIKEPHRILVTSDSVIQRLL